MLPARVCSRQVNESCMQAPNSLGQSLATGPMANLRIESSDVPAATVPASQLNELYSWYRASMCIFRRPSLEIETDQIARTADTRGYIQPEQRDSSVDGLRQSPNWKKKDRPMGRGLCQSKQTNKPQVVVEDEGHVISE
jgi:hypothetical protein